MIIGSILIWGVLTFFFFLIALAVTQILGVDMEKMQYKTGKLVKNTKRQIKIAIFATIGLEAILLLSYFFAK